MKEIVVVGASLAGLSTVRELRAQGYDGRLTVVGDEQHLPYDRPPLSKGFLSGDLGVADVALLDDDDQEHQELGVEWLLGERASSLDAVTRTVTVGSRRIRADGVVIATGATPRALPGAHTLRTLEDAIALREALLDGSPRVAVIGGGFIGAEVAATARKLGLDVTLVVPGTFPLEGALGLEMARICADLHRDNGVRLVTGTRVEASRDLPADLVIAGLGTVAATDWLLDSGIALDDGVLCDAGFATSIPNVVAVGDVARVPSAPRGGHWTAAVEQPKTAARTLLTGVSAPPPPTPPYFWSDQYDVRIQFAGRVGVRDQPEIVAGSEEERSFAAVYHRDGKPVAVLAMNRSKEFSRLRRSLGEST